MILLHTAMIKKITQVKDITHDGILDSIRTRIHIQFEEKVKEFEERFEVACVKD